MPAVPVRCGIPAHHQRSNNYLGLCHSRAVDGDNPTVEITVFIAEHLFTDPYPDEASRWLEVSRCLLHEMVHVAVGLDEIGGRYPEEIDDHGQEFADECNRIGRAIGWGHVAGADRAVGVEEDAKWWPSDGGRDVCGVVRPPCQDADVRDY